VGGGWVEGELGKRENCMRQNKLRVDGHRLQGENKGEIFMGV